MSQHSELTVERWARFGTAQQILQIAVELERGATSLRADRKASLALCYERVLRLTDLTVQVSTRANLRRELLRFRGLIGELFLLESPDRDAHIGALEVLLELHPESQQQLRVLDL